MSYFPGRNFCLHDGNYDLSYTVDATRHHVTGVYRSNSIRCACKDKVSGHDFKKLRQMRNAFLDIPYLQVQVAVLAGLAIDGKPDPACIRMANFTDRPIGAIGAE